ncbi:MAG TPA: hypothetical protein VF503_27710 [Sphingobium sp.]|uniref:hypothetical protein n=1 Tax=Sphingobium sp. TaxID=1912891 RepID=UPI002ED52D08
MDKADTPETRFKVPGFWDWLVKRDADGDRGLSNVVNRWLVFHVAIGAAAAYFSQVDATGVAKTVALPGSAILIGLAFGWAGRSASLLQDKSFSKFLLESGPSPEGYVYAFQLAVLAVLLFIGVALILIMGGTGVSTGSHVTDGAINRAILFFFGSVAVRESWGIIYFVNKLTIQYYRVREVELAAESAEHRIK